MKVQTANSYVLTGYVATVNVQNNNKQSTLLHPQKTIVITNKTFKSQIYPVEGLYCNDKTFITF